MNIIESEQAAEIIKKIIAGGASNLHLLADFDRTLTYGTLNGVRTPSVIALLRDGKHLTPDYAVKAHALFDKYHAYEVDDSLSKEERKAYMQEWWDVHNQLLIDSGLSLKDYEDIVQSGKIKFREGIVGFLNLLHEKKVPLVIISAAACGDAIKMYFKQMNCDFDNINYIVNRYQWGANGQAIATVKPTITVANKDEIMLGGFPNIFEKIKDRKNVILLGDGLDDPGMVEGFAYENLLKIGFLNPGFDSPQEAFQAAYDVVLEGDGDVAYLNKLLQQIAE